MSAAASGFTLNYIIKSPTEADLTGLRKGARALQKKDLCWVPSRAFEDWTVVRVKDEGIEVMPLTARWAKGTRCVPKQFFDLDYKIKPRSC